MKHISRTHILMLAIVSIFTGMIAPSVGTNGIFIPYAMTNMQYVAYVVLLISAVVFLCAAFRFRAVTTFLITALVVLILALWMMTIAGLVKNFSGNILQVFHWGWMFLIVGLLLLFHLLIMKSEKYGSSDFSGIYEKIIGITGFMVLFLLSVFIIFVAEKTAKKVEHKAELNSLFTADEIFVNSGATLSRGFAQIENFSFDRKNDFLSFIATDNGEKIFYPTREKLANPDEILDTVSFQGRNFFIQKNGTIVENGKILGILAGGNQKENFILLKNPNNSYTLISNRYEVEISWNFENIDKVFYAENTKDIYWKTHTDEGDIIFKNGKKFSENYDNILRYAVSREGNLMLVVEDENGEKMIIRDNTVIHTIHENYVQGTFQMNGNDTLYVIQNADDKSFSVVVNGIIMDRRLDEIRDVFLEKNSSGFSYFGRPQAEPQYCLFTRYKGNLCGLSGYMNPQLNGDGVDVIFAGLKDGKWSIYRNTTEFIKNINYSETKNISGDFFFFDVTTPRYFLIVQKKWDKYMLNKMWKNIPELYDDVDVESVEFGYDEKIFITVKQGSLWKIAEL